jgi:hypothetical protein
MDSLTPLRAVKKSFQLINIIKSTCLTLLFCGSVSVSAADPSILCNIREFDRIALTTHDAEKRRRLAYKWVEEHGPKCRQSDLMYIYNNAPLLLGTANHPELRELIYFLFYAKE